MSEAQETQDRQFITRLLESSAPESKRLDYKRELPGRNDDAKKAFAWDICAMANADGGHIVYGIDANAGEATPSEIVGCECESTDKEIQRLELILSDRIKPRLTPRPDIRSVRTDAGKLVFIVEIKKSWMSPHMISTGRSDFPIRVSSKNDHMDIEQIRRTIIQSNQIPHALRQLDSERTQKVIDGKGPAVVGNSKLMLIRLIPLSSVFGVQGASLERLDVEASRLRLFDLHSDKRFNLDGILLYTNANTPENMTRGYYQIFRDGMIEAVRTISDFTGAQPGVQYNFMDGKHLHDKIVGALDQFLQFYISIQITTPIYLFLTLVGIGNHIVVVPPIQTPILDDLQGYQINEELLRLPEVQIDDLTEPAHKIIRPSLDALWQASGCAFCPLYSREGQSESGSR